MTQSITVAIPSELNSALDDLSQREGISKDDVVGRAIKEHLFQRQFRSLRERLMAKAANQGGLTDQDVFDRVS